MYVDLTIGGIMEEELVNFLEEGEEIILNSIFSTKDKLIHIWKETRAFNEEIKEG
jgi:hypothetical protein